MRRYFSLNHPAAVHRILLCFLLASSIASVSAGAEETNQLMLSPEEALYMKRLQSKSVFTIATRISDHVYFPQENGSIKGLYYHMAKDFADHFNLRLSVKTVRWFDYFSKNGKFPQQVRQDAEYVYTPDLIQEVDVYVDAFTLYPWREKIFTMVKLFPIKTMAITRKGEGLADIKDLKGKILAIQPQSTYADTLNAIEKKLSANFHYLEVKSFTEGLKAVSEGRADVTCMDSHDAWITQYENLDMSIPLSDIQYICWIVKKEDKILAAILRKFFYHAMESGSFDRLWVDNYNIPFSRYLKMIYLKNLE